MSNRRYKVVEQPASTLYDKGDARVFRVTDVRSSGRSCYVRQRVVGRDILCARCTKAFPYGQPRRGCVHCKAVNQYLENFRAGGVYVIDLLEHGNGGVHGVDILDYLPVDKALKKSPADYGVTSKEWGFWPVLAYKLDGHNDPAYTWNEDRMTWEKVEV